MRLLYTASDGKLLWTKDIIRSEEIPPYAILSHTWGEQEVVFDDLKSLDSVKDVDAQKESSWNKIRFCAQQAERDGLEHFWVDTCCIDKSNSQELQEAINSMFSWYQNAKKCYVYLSDVEYNTPDAESESSPRWKPAFRKSKWFNRGWTLQELLAPASVVFYSKEGDLLGDKQSLKDTIHEITGIPIEALQGSPLTDFSVAERFSWTEYRETTREEDAAYCLLGIFGICMTLRYTEGKDRAITRLRQKVQRPIKDIEERFSKICSWLSAPDPSTNYHKAHKQRQAETGLWLLESAKFTKWKESAASRLWLYGIPGCGKTILSSTIIQHLIHHCDDDVRVVTAYFYFDFNDAQKQDAELMLRSLLCQLLQRSLTIPKGVDALFSSCENGQRQPSLDALLEVTRQAMQEFAYVYVVVDALDECTQRSELMDMLETVAGWRLDNLHLLMTSRKERDIETSLESYVGEEATVCLQTDVVDQDIQRYVRQRLRVNKGLAKWNKDAAIRQEIETAMMRGACGMFRWAACQLDTLEKCCNRAMLRKSLATLPRTLDQTYDRILFTISEEYSEYAMRILQWLTFSARPLSVEEMAEVVAIDVARDPAFDRDEVLEDPLEVLNICSSLVTITRSEADGTSRPAQQIIALAHYSVQEYLVSDRIKQGSAKQYSMQEAECHNAITKGSLKYIMQLQQPLSEEALQMSALARYAAEFWSNHFRKMGEKVEGLCQLAMDLMSVKTPAYLTWVQLYNPDYPWMKLNLEKGLDSIAAPLYYAALLDLNTITRMLLDQGAEVNKQGGRYGNALHAASLRGHKRIVQILIKAGAEVDAQNGDYGNALQAASSEGHELIVKMLLDNKANINAQGGKYSNALQAAAAAGHQAIVQLLLDNGADVNRQGGLYGNALNAAAAECHATIVKLLLENAAEISRHDDQGKSVLHHATNSAYCTHTLVEFLLSQGAPANTIDMENMTPLHYSVKLGHERIAGLLLDNGVSIDAGVHRKTCSRNTVKTDPPCRMSIPESKPDISCISAGLTPLHFAALAGNSVMTKFLLKRGADPNALSEYNESPMHLTLRKTLHGPKYADDWTNQDWRVENLLDFLDFEDETDAIHADIRTHREGVLDAMFADVRTSLTIRDHHHDHPLHCVEYGKFGSVEMVEKLVSRGANPFERNMKQQSALHLASRAGNHDAVAVLLSLGVELALTDSEGLHALHHAARSGNHETINILLETAMATRPSLLVSKDTLGRNSLHHLLSTTSRVQHETLQLMLDKGIDGSELDASGNSPLASYFKGHWLGPNVNICQQLLLVKGSSLFVDRKGQNLGHLCASTLRCSVRVFETLREHGVDLTQKDLQSRTLLHCAALRGSITEESLHYLLHVVGVEINAEDASGKTALQHATEMASKDRNPQSFDPRRWDRSEKLLSKSDGKYTKIAISSPL
ncbi:hypothetical protein HBI25_177950 [Parastagonospora nodorum]|nr:hypothetical protein HBI25_177950 [Parastagonospora nodorum]